ncbi:MAG: hypothetical protein ACFFCT_03050 [Candidatus Odinarchaeota archaeon]
MVTVDPKRVVRCRWFDAFEGDNWMGDIFGKGQWCSKRCYEAGHLGTFLFSSILFLTLSATMLPYMFLFYIYVGNEMGLLSAFILAIIFITFAVYSPILTYRSYNHRKKIIKIQE